MLHTPIGRIISNRKKYRSWKNALTHWKTISKFDNIIFTVGGICLYVNLFLSLALAITNFLQVSQSTRNGLAISVIITAAFAIYLFVQAIIDESE